MVDGVKVFNRGSSNDDSKWNIWMHHNELLIWIGYISSWFVAKIIDSVITSVITLVFCALITFAAITWYKHKGIWCEVCMNEHPANGEEELLKKKYGFINLNLLQYLHTYRMTIGTVIILTIYIAGPFFWTWLPIFAMIGNLYQAYAMHTHRKLEPWCPWCRGRGGDDDEAPVTPPVPSETADR